MLSLIAGLNMEGIVKWRAQGQLYMQDCVLLWEVTEYRIVPCTAHALQRSLLQMHYLLYLMLWDLLALPVP